MKQPELGIRIAELRKAKGLTQEELVGLCNISVRTIQRIETGEVSPRSYTVKTILAALDADLNSLSEENTSSTDRRNNSMWMDPVGNSSPESVIKQLYFAAFFGICYFILGFLEGAAEFSRFFGDGWGFEGTVYVVIKVSLLFSFIFFQRGFLLMGGIFNNYLLKIASAILIAINVLIIGFDVVSVYFNVIDPDYIMVSASLIYGAAGIIYGLALTRLDSHIGLVAKLAGIFEILAAVCFLTVVFSVMGLFIQVPAELLGIITLFKATEVLKPKADATLA